METKKKYNIILEGCDCCGKDTVARYIEAKLQRLETKHCIPVKHNQRTEINEYIKLDEQYWKLNQKNKRYSLYNRWYGISDLVYNPNTTDADIVFIANFLKCNPEVQVVFFNITEDVLRERLKNRGDEFYNIEELLQYRQLYVVVFNMLRNLGVPVLWYDVDSAIAFESREAASKFFADSIICHLIGDLD